MKIEIKLRNIFLNDVKKRFLKRNLLKRIFLFRKKY